MRTLQVVQEGILYRNPMPGHRVICASVPNVIPLDDRELLCLYRIGQAFYALDGRLAKLRSEDGGTTWIEEGLVWDPRDDAQLYTYMGPHATLLRDGTLVLIASRYLAVEENLHRFNPATGGLKPFQVVLLRSEDRGRHWSRPEVIDLPSAILDPPSSVIELNDGRWFLAFEAWKAWDDASPLHIKGLALFSHDRGQTWGDRLDFPSASHSSKMFSHTRYARMLDGRICGLQWTQSIGGQENLDLHLVISDPAGRQWGSPQPTGIPAQTSWIAHLGNASFAATFTVREKLRPGIAVALSQDGGRTWDLENQVLVWDAVGQEYLGVTHRPSYPASHDNIAFGKPHTARLSNGDVFSSWWCTQACVTHIRYARLAVE